MFRRFADHGAQALTEAISREMQRGATTSDTQERVRASCAMASRLHMLALIARDRAVALRNWAGEVRVRARAERTRSSGERGRRKDDAGPQTK